MRRLHLVAGLVALAVFLATGVYMKMHVHNLDTERACSCRSSHIHLLFAALLNLVLGLHDEPVQTRAGACGSGGQGRVLVLMAPRAVRAGVPSRALAHGPPDGPLRLPGVYQ